MDNHKKDQLLENSSKILKLLMKHGAASGEVFGAMTLSKQISFSSKRIHEGSIAERIGYGLRFQKNGNNFFLSVDDIDFKTIKKIITHSLNNPAQAYSSKPLEFAQPAQTKVNSNFSRLADPKIREISLDEMVSSVKSISDIIATNPSPFFLNSALYSTSETHIAFINSNEQELNYSDTFLYFQAQLVAGTRSAIDLTQTISRMYRTLDVKLESILEQELDRSKDYTKIKRVNDNQIIPVLFNSNCMSQLGDLILRPFLSSVLTSLTSKNRKKLRVSPEISLKEKSDDPQRIGTRPFDHEGTYTKSINLIQDGDLKEIPLNLQQAKDEDKSPTGTSLRGMPLLSSLYLHRIPPTTLLTNLTVSPSNDSDDSLIQDIKKGIKLDGFHSLNYFNIKSGDFELSSTEAFHIKNGKLKKSTGKINIFGNIFELLSLIEAVGSKTTIGYFSLIPSLKVSRVRVLGKPKKGLTGFLVSK